MRKNRSYNRRSGIGQVEWALIIAGVAIVVIAGVSQLGSLLSTDIEQTADGVGDPAQLVNHSRFTGQPYSPPDNGENNGNNNSGGNDNGNNGNNGGGNNNDGGNDNGDNGNGNNGNGNGNGGGNSGGNGNGGNGGGGWFWGWFGW